jgi:hypothetical protein
MKIFTTVLISFFALFSSYPTDLQFTEHVILENIQGGVCLGAQDLNGDGYIDIAATGCTGNHVSWLQNDGNQNFTQHVIQNNFLGARVLDVKKVDSDNDYDIIVTAFTGNKISWFENDGIGNFTEHIITDSMYRPSFVFGFDIDKDQDLDIVATSCKGHEILWFENDGSQNFTEHLLKENWSGANFADVSDIDSDGDYDIVATAKAGDVIIFSNDGNEFFTEDTVISNWGEASSVQAGDIDSDGDIDLAVTNCGNKELTWFENVNDSLILHTIRQNFPGARSPVIVDFDKDGHVDIVAVAWGTFSSSAGSVASIFLNDSTDHNFTEHIFVPYAYDLVKLFVIDLDEDGDNDILGATYMYHEIRWWENLEITSDVGNNPTINPDGFLLYQNYPNPFNPSTKIKFTITDVETYSDASLLVKLKVFDLLGNEITTLINEEKSCGNYEIEFSSVGTSRDFSLPSGIYFYRLQAGNFVQTKKWFI